MRTRALFALLLLCGIGSAQAENSDNHILLSCTPGHTVKKTTFEDGRVRTEKEKASALQIDVDLENKKINGRYEAPYGQRFENGSVTIGGYASKLATEHEAGYQDTISIDRLSGAVVVTHLHHPSDDCTERSGRTDVCRMSEATTTYHCAPAVGGFPTPIPKLLRVWERFHHSHFWARMRRAWHRLSTSVERQIWPSESDR